MQVMRCSHPVKEDHPDDAVIAPFKTCTMCLQSWRDAESFISDPSLVINGYQAFFDNPERGLILFTHKIQGCGSTIAVPAGVFKPLYHGPDYLLRNFGEPSCCGHCLQDHDLEQCNAECDMRWVRDVLQMLRRYRAR
jgi:hypothetical protein